MSRKLLKINELKLIYSSCSNPEKEKIIDVAIDSIKCLPIVEVNHNEE